MRIFLIGFMGSGKTTVGKSMANKLQLKFIDLDNYIEEITGKEISEIFEEKGETVFRQIEKKALNEVLKTNNFVLSCGGGTPCFFNNMENMNKKGVTVYLKYPAGKLKSRLLPNIRKRPLLNDIHTQEDLVSFIREKIKEREKYYLESKIVIDNPARISDIMASVKLFLKK